MLSSRLLCLKTFRTVTSSPLTPIQGNDNLTLQELRDDLRASLSNYKLPTILRVVPELRKTANMKIPKLLLKKELFEVDHPNIQKWTARAAKL